MVFPKTEAVVVDKHGNARSFLAKLGAAAGVVLIGDQIIYNSMVVPGTGILALCWAAAVLIGRWRAVHRGLVLPAAGFAIVMIEDPNPLAWLLFSIALASAVLASRVVRFDDAWSWCGRLLVLVAGAIAAPLRDVAIWRAVHKRRGGRIVRGWRDVGWLPLAGSTVFAALFIAANPLLLRAVSGLDAVWPTPFDVVRMCVWLVIFGPVWSLLRPLRISVDTRQRATSDWQLPGVSPSAIRASLICFNLLFALQNGLDIAFLWSAAALPADVSMAEYAHQGAYLLILTALLAGGFVVLVLGPGTPGAQDRTIRRLVGIWIAQNVVLVASSMLRTADYIAAYSMTVLRIAALLWMGLVGDSFGSSARGVRGCRSWRGGSLVERASCP